MKYHYEPGSVRWFRWAGGDPRGYCPPKGWEAVPDQLDYHPITGKRFRDAPQWWVREDYVGGE